MSEKCVITLDQTDELQKKAFTFAYELAKNAELSNETLCDFWNKLVVNKEVYEEFVYFMEHGDYLCKANIEHVNVIDIMIWQMDHFKAQLDQDKTKAKQNGDYMVFTAFYTFVKMYENPEPILESLSRDTGSDYLDKYQAWS